MSTIRSTPRIVIVGSSNTDMTIKARRAEIDDLLRRSEICLQIRRFKK